ncbi:hypothetical protein [Periweissella cryptocerci]|uniref:hypothetical protein n=1 Tax=Periweissella cryptocerci TaxID=2506420 RepID=UPI00140446D1|nr:hypothetical protein [Periweissella cryptocerci]
MSSIKHYLSRFSWEKVKNMIEAAGIVIAASITVLVLLKIMLVAGNLIFGD